MLRRAVTLGAAGSVVAVVAGRHVAWARHVRVIAQALVPWSALAGWPLAIANRRSGERRLAMLAAVTGAAGIAMAVDLRGRVAPTPPAGPSLAVAHVNLLYLNRADAGVPVLTATGADVLTFSEYTPAHADAFLASPLAAAYPHRAERPRPRAGGIALWSRHPFTEIDEPPLCHERVSVDVDVPGDGVVRVVAIHPISPMAHYADWRGDLATLAASPPPAVPAVMTGDFNAAWFHPELRAIVGRGWRSAHRERGRGLSCSWRDDYCYRPFVRLDHALVNDGLAVVDVVDFSFPRSDHRGLVVRVTPTRRAAP